MTIIIHEYIYKYAIDNMIIRSAQTVNVSIFYNLNLIKYFDHSSCTRNTHGKHTILVLR